jgi:hypothetical protein
VLDPGEPIFGLPPRMVIAAIGFTGAVLGLLWLRRTTQVEGESRSFRSMATPERDRLAIVAVIVLVALVALIASVVLGR